MNLQPNYSKWENIKKAINSEYDNFDYSFLRPYVWKDEIGDIFFLTRCMEIYFYDKTVLRCLCWSKHYGNILSKMSEISFITGTDDGLYIFESNISNLVDLLMFPLPIKKRTRKNSKKLIRLEEKLGHKILPFRFPLQKGEKKKDIPDALKPFMFTKGASER